MKPADTISTLFRHNRWANLRLLERCADLTEEHLDAGISGTYGSIRDTLGHIVTAERWYFSGVSTGELQEDPSEPATIAEMIEMAGNSGSGLVEWAPKVKAEDITIEVNADGTRWEVPTTVILTQVINHATEHRAQVMATMTQAGVQPPDLQAWRFLDELSE
jgi:uncharacterized damage-inducible protein DinB